MTDCYVSADNRPEAQIASSVHFGEGITEIQPHAFQGRTDIKTVVIPDGVTSIGAYAFEGCSGLGAVVIPDSVTSIGAFAFAKCTSLSSIVIPDGVPWIDVGTFEDCKNLSSVVIPDSVTSIDERAFLRCTNLSSIVIPNGVTSIGNFAFQGCRNLSSLAIPDGVTRIGNAALLDVRSIIYNGPMDSEYDWGAERLIRTTKKRKIKKRAKGIRIGDSLFLGRYPQASKDAPEPIEWKILNLQGDGVFVVSRYVLESAPFHHKCEKLDRWQDADLCKWLQEVFYNAVFTDEEKEVITEISLLTIEDIDYYIRKRYCEGDDIPGAGAKSTPHAHAHTYWTRNIKDPQDLALSGIDEDSDAVYLFYSNDAFSWDADFCNYHGVRPVLWLKRRTCGKFIKPAERTDGLDGRSIAGSREIGNFFCLQALSDDSSSVPEDVRA